MHRVPASIEGVVVEQGTNNAVPRVTLDLRAVDNPVNRYPAIATGEGKFSFRNVLPGRYSLVASRAGYVRSEYGQRGPNGAATVLEVRAGQAIRDLRISMIPSGGNFRPRVRQQGRTRHRTHRFMPGESRTQKVGEKRFP